MTCPLSLFLSRQPSSPTRHAFFEQTPGSQCEPRGSRIRLCEPRSVLWQLSCTRSGSLSTGVRRDVLPFLDWQRDPNSKSYGYHRPMDGTGLSHPRWFIYRLGWERMYNSHSHRNFPMSYLNSKRKTLYAHLLSSTLPWSMHRLIVAD